MDWFRKLPGATRSAPGLEWRIWRRLPAVLLWGTVLPALAALALHFTAAPVPTPAEMRMVQLAQFVLIGAVAFHWTLVITVGMGCVVVMVMKGPAYVADGYEPEVREPRSG